MNEARRIVATSENCCSTGPEPAVARSGAERDRTDDLRLAKPALSQLSYSPGTRCEVALAATSASA